MATQTKTEANVEQAVPFFRVSSMEMSLRFYVDGLGFEMTKKWTPDSDGKVRWCWCSTVMPQSCCRSSAKTAPTHGRRNAKLAWAFPFASSAKTQWPSIRMLRRGGSRRRGRSSETECGSRPCRSRWLQTRLRKPDRCSGRDGIFRRLIAVPPDELQPLQGTAIGAEVEKTC
jgi:hypothetical protein